MFTAITPSRLILAEQLGGRAPPRLILEIDVSELLAGVISLIAGGALKGLTTQNRP
jgi:hypothetical protein